MATLTERHESRVYNSDGSITMVYDLREAGSNAKAAYTLLLDSLPADYDDRILETHPGMEPVYVDEVENVGHYLVRSRYIAPEVVRAAEEEVLVTIATMGGTRRLTQAYKHIKDYGASASNHKGSIGVTEDGPQGTDVTDPGIAITIQRRYALGSLPDTSEMVALRGKVNSDAVTIKDTRKDRTWLFEPGTLLCTGFAEETMDDDELTSVTYNLEASENLDGLTIGEIAGVAKKGHEHLWVEYASSVDGTKKLTKPKWAHVEQVYPTVGMDGLGWAG